MLVFVITITILAIGLFIFAYVIPTIGNGLKLAGMNSTSEGANAIDQMNELGTSGMQRGFFLLFFGLTASLFITSFFSDVHPIFLFLYIIFLAISILLAVYLGNMYEQMASQPIFASILASQGFINTVMSNIVMIMLSVGAITIIITFVKFSSVIGGSRL